MVAVFMAVGSVDWAAMKETLWLLSSLPWGRHSGSQASTSQVPRYWYRESGFSAKATPLPAQGWPVGHDEGAAHVVVRAPRLTNAQLSTVLTADMMADDGGCYSE